MRKIALEEFHAELKGQGVSSPEHAAVKCPACGTVQSKALLRKQGCPEDSIEGQIGFSCVGRWNDAGPPPRKDDAAPRRVPGCNWTLGGLFSIHDLEVQKDGVSHPMFEVASPEEARKLESSLVSG
ncbi:VVA0879 family protein [uncultured Salinicola sp.]|uniref:VVA0879 family protein n=1 Tax=uncultured Salinicola sp. TaxID=1193542 RepID=UPI002625492E|nr:VVA0879 family protein [uncultured Salinicola sp.]|tara:strand:+ start:825 stop:1202 length:378 start_codon:yes stop_codon:yes gene_type:complete